MEKLTLLISLTLLPLFSVFSQVETIKRIEFELKEGFASHDLAKFDDNGILMVYYSIRKVRTKKEKQGNGKLNNILQIWNYWTLSLLKFLQNSF